MNHAQYDQETGKPLDQSYLECGLPDDLQASIQEAEILIGTSTGVI